MTFLPIFANIFYQGDDGGLFAAFFGSFFYCVCWSIILVLIFAGLWKTFVKAGRPGWAAIIPIYDLYILCEIAGRPGWWCILYLIPFVNIVVSLLVAIDLAKAFGKDVMYGVVLLWLFQAVGYLVLGFSDAQYVGPAKATS